jgi:hypothetical protein
MDDETFELGERIAETSAHLDAALHRLLTDLREFDARGGWYKAGALTCGHWLSWRVGWELGTAREHVRVAKALGELPLIDGALRRGEVSYSKVRAMTRVATALNERLILEDAKLVTGEQLERLCRKYAMVQRHADADRPSDDVHRRYVRRRDLADGMVKVEAVLHPDEAAIVWAALDRAAQEMAAEPRSTDVPAGTPDTAEHKSNDVPAGTRETGDAASTDVPAGTSAAVAPRPRFDRADGLLLLAQQFASGGHASTPIEVVVTVPAHALREGAPIDVLNTGAFAGGDCVESETARRLACDAGIVEMTEDEHGELLSVGRKTRAIPTAIRRALLKRDRCCRFPGCTNYLYVEGHHVKHWADGGETALHNLVTLCSRHHRFVHEYMYRVTFDTDGEPQFFDASGRPAHDVPPPIRRGDLGWTHVLATNRAYGAVPETMECWDGTEVDYGVLIDDLVRADDGLLSPEWE